MGLLLRSSVSDGSPYSDCTVYYCYYYYYYSFSFFLSGRFLRNGLTDFLEIFRKDAVHQFLGKFFSFVENSLPVGKYGRFSFFKKCFCPAVFSQTVNPFPTRALPAELISRTEDNMAAAVMANLISSVFAFFLIT
jgi:hypothetical protein